VQQQPVLGRTDATTGPPLLVQHPTSEIDQIGMRPVQPRGHHRHLGLEVVDLLLAQDHRGGKAHASIVHLFERHSGVIHSEFRCAA
jgi:hypothetical protein